MAEAQSAATDPSTAEALSAGCVAPSGWKMNVDVVDSGANLVFFLRMDGAQLASIGVIASRGGIPLIEYGKLVGAVGCSGGAHTQYEAGCKAGLAALNRH
jgi:glc operon protein GlcG